MSRAAVARVVDWLDERSVRHALCGGLAMSAWGAARSTSDLDLLVADRRVLEPGFWGGFRGGRVTVRPDRSHRGLARGPRAPEGGRWVAGIVDRATRRVTFARTQVPVVAVSDLVLLKLYAGGFLDLRDVALLLETPDGRNALADVESRLPELPDDAQAAWHELRARSTPRSG